MNEDSKVSTPRFALRFLRWFCPPELYESIEGDLVEQFEEDLNRADKTERWARQRFAWNVIRFFRPGVILRNKFSTPLIHTIMIGNYFKVASRNILKRKLYSFINAFGLSIGIAFCILIYLYIQDEKSFDQFHENKNDIYCLNELSYNTWAAQKGEDPMQRSAYLPAPLTTAMKQDIPEVKFATRFIPDNNGIVRYGDKVFTESISYADKDFFSMFSFPLLSGNREKLFSTKDEVVLTKELVTKYFGDEDPLGKTIIVDAEGEKMLTVTGVMERPPANSSIDFKILVPMEHKPYFRPDHWGSFSYHIMVQLAPLADPARFKINLDKTIEKHMGDRLERWREEGNIPPEYKVFEVEFTTIANIHLNTKVGWFRSSDPQYSYILGGIAVLILVIACINYISLALTTSAARRVEVGIRKVAGAQRGQLIYQFGIESVLLAFISMLFGLILVAVFLPSFNDFTSKGITISGEFILPLLGVSIVVSALIGTVAGSYPALFLSRFLPAVVLKGRFTSRLKAGFTLPLVVIQFFLSAFLVISSVIMYRQMQFVTSKDLGFDKEQTLVIPTQAGWTEEADKVVERFRSRFISDGDVVSVSGTSSSFNHGWSRYGYKIDGENKAAYVYRVDPYYIDLLGLEFAEGRNFDESRPSDSTAIIVNESLVRDMKWTDPLSEYLNWREDSLGKGSPVIGVLKDYHFLSLEQEIEPMFLCMDKKEVGYLTTMLIKVTPGDIPDKLEKVRNAWTDLYPDKPFDYTFMDQDVAHQYDRYQHWMSIMALSTIFAIIIACLGLFGLTGINVVNRTKEIGIRKVMGAGISNIFLLLNKQYIWLALIAFVLAAPLSWYVMDRWLESFKFSITIGWELFVVSMLAGLVIAFLTVSYHGIKAALINPAETLKYE